MRYALAGLSVLLIGLIIYSANTGRATHLMELVQSTAHADKVLHFLLFGGLSFVVNWAFESHRLVIGNARFYVGTVVVGLYVVIDEFSHRYLPTRNFDYYDLLANVLGLLVFALVTHATFKRRLMPAPDGKVNRV